MKFRTYYDNNYVDEGIEFDLKDSVTDQDFKLHTDIDYLLSHMAGHSRTPLYGVQDTMTFEDWSNEMAMLKRRFMNLSPDMQKKFGNPQEFLQWCSDPNNYVDELPSVVEGRKSKERLEKEKQYREEKSSFLASKIAEALKKE